MKNNYVKIICTAIYFILLATILISIVGVFLFAILVHPYAIILMVPVILLAPIVYVIASKILMFSYELEIEVLENE